MAHPSPETTVAILIDCDNVQPDIVDFALRMAAQAGRVTTRRGYGNPKTLGQKWEEALVRQAFTPCLQYQYASKKNTADIALALDALETLFDKRADTFCLVTSDSDFAYLCRKLRERGANVYIVGEQKSPPALRNACDRFFEWVPNANHDAKAKDVDTPEAKPAANKQKPEAKPAPAGPLPKRRPRFLVEAVELLASSSPDGRVALNTLGQYLKRADPAFSPSGYGHSGLLSMVKTYDLLTPHEEEGGQWTVSLAPKAEV